MRAALAVVWEVAGYVCWVAGWWLVFAPVALLWAGLILVLLVAPACEGARGPGEWVRRRGG